MLASKNGARASAALSTSNTVRSCHLPVWAAQLCVCLTLMAIMGTARTQSYLGSAGSASRCGGPKKRKLKNHGYTHG